MTSINWDDLRVFLAVFREGSVRGAARKIGKTHATVSRHIQTLNDAIGGRTFERGQSGQYLTDLGEKILPHAEAVEDSVAAIDRIAYGADTRLSGPIKISLSQSLYAAVLYQALDDFMANYPLIELAINGSNAFSKLAWREADIVIRITNTPEDTAYGKKVADSPLGTYASEEYLANRPQNDRWISLDYGPAEKPTIPAQIVARAETPLLAAQMISMGRGVGALPCYVGDTTPNLHRLPETQIWADKQIWVLTHHDLRKNPKITALMKHLYTAFDTRRDLIEGRCPKATPHSGHD
ncbi:MAG: LysR family transcriptional regulator [Henriciella sp.]|nr:LysR family transcriptional regulator [Henriciella sp.]